MALLTQQLGAAEVRVDMLAQGDSAHGLCELLYRVVVLCGLSYASGPANTRKSVCQRDARGERRGRESHRSLQDRFGLMQRLHCTTTPVRRVVRGVVRGQQL